MPATSLEEERLTNRVSRRRPGEECAAVADLAYAVLLIGVFVVLALTLRGLERL
ncbi:hypothetical protein [Saccharomonospora xinjiangensis]|uniref:hypothetical protein n=1 Tax=Saccharomonospora xinjiangensis TaxID=75294 RepID=UPI0014302F54|nr:hypothetical protein [Saccharomonospora xinjiangensis]